MLAKDLLLIGRQFIGIAWRVNLPDDEFETVLCGALAHRPRALRQILGYDEVDEVISGISLHGFISTKQ